MPLVKPASRKHAFWPPRLLTGLWYRFSGLTAEPASALPDDIATRLAPGDDDFRNISFTFAVIALSASVACADGKLSRAKYIAFREAFPLSGSICAKIRALFTLACQNTTPFELYATQIKFSFPNQTPLFVSLVGRLYSIAVADGEISPNSERMLARIAHILGLTAPEYMAIRDRYLSPQPHNVLGVPRRTSTAKLKKRYRELMYYWHPDRFAGEDISPELSMLLKLKASEINEAYRHLSKKAA